MSKLQINTSNAQAFYDLMFNQCKPREAIEKFVGDEYIQHNLNCYQKWPGDQEYAGIDIFRFDGDGKIVEHWDVLQVVAPESKNDNGLF